MVMPSKGADKKGRKSSTKPKKSEKSKYSKQKKNYESLEERSFNNQLSSLGLHISYMEADGNCMFRSIADQVCDNPEDHLTFRHKIVSYIEENKEHFELFLDDTETFDDYIERMKNPHEWGDHMELFAASQCLNINICVHQINAPNYILPAIDNKTLNKTIHVSYHGDCHYNSVRALNTHQHNSSVISFSPKKEDVEIVMKSISWASEEDVLIGLEMMDGNIENTIDFLCMNVGKMHLYGNKLEGRNVGNDDIIVKESENGMKENLIEVNEISIGKEKKEKGKKEIEKKDKKDKQKTKQEVILNKKGRPMSKKERRQWEKNQKTTNEEETNLSEKMSEPTEDISFDKIGIVI